MRYQKFALWVVLFWVGVSHAARSISELLVLSDAWQSPGTNWVLYMQCQFLNPSTVNQDVTVTLYSSAGTVISNAVPNDASTVMSGYPVNFTLAPSQVYMTPRVFITSPQLFPRWIKVSASSTDEQGYIRGTCTGERAFPPQNLYEWVQLNLNGGRPL